MGAFAFGLRGVIPEKCATGIAFLSQKEFRDYLEAQVVGPAPEYSWIFGTETIAPAVTRAPERGPRNILRMGGSNRTAPWHRGGGGTTPP